MSSKKLDPSFYLQDTISIARKLLGQKLVRMIGKEEKLSGLIVETEAYLGLEDPTCHSFKGRRSFRTQSMFLSGGHAYVYFTYGMHYCLNVVTRTEKEPEAVLIRALQPLEGEKKMELYRGGKKREKRDLTNGPAKLCQALKINQNLDGESLLGSKLYIEKRTSKIHEKDIIESPRIGINLSKGDASEWPLRFFLRDNIFVSRKS